MLKDSKLIKQLTLFGLVGGMSFLIDFVVTSVLFNYLNTSAFFAGVVGFSSAFIFNFPINRKHVFNHSKNDKFNIKTQIIMYASVSVLNLFITGLALQYLVENNLLTISYAKILMTILIAIWNFLLFRFVIFSKRPNPDDLDSLTIQ